MSERSAVVGRPLSFVLPLSFADTVEAVVFDANGRELFAEVWLVEGAAPPTLGTPSVYSVGGLKVRFGDLECDSAE